MKSLKRQLIRVDFNIAGPKPSIEVIYVSPRIFHSKQPQGAKKSDVPPLIVVLHGGPHSVSQTTYSRPLVFLSALGFSLLHVNYRFFPFPLSASSSLETLQKKLATFEY